MMTNGRKSKPVDQEALYGVFNESTQRRQRWHDKAIHKALNLPMEDDDMQFNQSSGLTVGHLLGIAVIAGVLFVGASLWKPSEPAPPMSAPGVTDTEYDVRFYDREGNLIDVPQREPKE